MTVANSPSSDQCSSPVSYQQGSIMLQTPVSRTRIPVVFNRLEVRMFGKYLKKLRLISVIPAFRRGVQR